MLSSSTRFFCSAKRKANRLSPKISVPPIHVCNNRFEKSRVSPRFLIVRFFRIKNFRCPASFNRFPSSQDKPRADKLPGVSCLSRFENRFEHLFLKILPDAFFDVSEANLTLPRVRSRTRYFPRLKTQITGF